MGGLKKYMPVTFATMLVGWLAISGVPFLSGFFSKDEILYRSFIAEGLPDSAAKILWFVGALTALLTAIYMTRLMVLTFWGSERPAAKSHSDASAHNHAAVAHESPRSMTLPLVVLAVGAVFAGYLGVPAAFSGARVPNYFDRLVERSLAHNPPEAVSNALPLEMPAPSPHAESASRQLSEEERTDLVADQSTEISLAVVSSIIAFLGIGIGWLWFNRRPLWQPPRLLEEKYYVDEIYDAAVVQPVKRGSIELLWKFIDVRIIDGAVNGAGHLAREFGAGMRYLQSGLARSYVAVLVLGALLIIGYFVIK